MNINWKFILKVVVLTMAITIMIGLGVTLITSCNTSPFLDFLGYFNYCVGALFVYLLCWDYFQKKEKEK